MQLYNKQHIEYKPEEYWDEVAGNLQQRAKFDWIAGDDDPYYIYKRKLVLRLLTSLNWADKNVLEVGPGPGGNLEVLLQQGAKHATGVDLSAHMLQLAKERLKNHSNVELLKTDGQHLPLPDRWFDSVFSVTVLQHITHTPTLTQLISEMCRTSSKEVIIFERIEKVVTGHESNLGRPVHLYEELFAQHGFHLQKAVFLPLQASYYACGAIRKLFLHSSHTEGRSQAKFVYFLQKLILPVTSLVDSYVRSNRDVAMLLFVRNE